MQENELNLLKGKDIVAIINACSAASVKKFKLGQLEISFGAQEEAIPEHQPTMITYQAESLPSKEVLSEDMALKRIIDESLENINDPLAYETRLMES